MSGSHLEIQPMFSWPLLWRYLYHNLVGKKTFRGNVVRAKKLAALRKA